MCAHNYELESNRNTSENPQKQSRVRMKEPRGGVSQTSGGLACVTLGTHQTLVFMKVAKAFIGSIHEVYYGIHSPKKARRRKV